MKKVSKILVTVGLILILGSASLNIYTKYKENQAKNKFTEKISEVSDSVTEEIKLGDEVALIDIESINLSSVIVSGINKEQIRYYVGHFENTPMPGKNGNFSIAGHRSTIYNQVFNNIDKLSIGDEIVVTSTNGKFTYEVSEIFETEATNMSVLDQDNGIKEMTIVTCTKTGKERVIVKAILKEDV